MTARTDRSSLGRSGDGVLDVSSLDRLRDDELLLDDLAARRPVDDTDPLAQLLGAWTEGLDAGIDVPARQTSASGATTGVRGAGLGAGAGGLDRDAAVPSRRSGSSGSRSGTIVRVSRVGVAVGLAATLVGGATVAAAAGGRFSDFMRGSTLSADSSAPDLLRARTTARGTVSEPPVASSLAAAQQAVDRGDLAAASELLRQVADALSGQPDSAADAADAPDAAQRLRTLAGAVAAGDGSGRGAGASGAFDTRAGLGGLGDLAHGAVVPARPQASVVRPTAPTATRPAVPGLTSAGPTSKPSAPTTGTGAAASTTRAPASGLLSGASGSGASGSGSSGSGASGSGGSGAGAAGSGSVPGSTPLSGAGSVGSAGSTGPTHSWATAPRAGGSGTSPQVTPTTGARLGAPGSSGSTGSTQSPARPTDEAVTLPTDSGMRLLSEPAPSDPPAPTDPSAPEPAAAVEDSPAARPTVPAASASAPAAAAARAATTKPAATKAASKQASKQATAAGHGPSGTGSTGR